MLTCLFLLGSRWKKQRNQQFRCAVIGAQVTDTQQCDQVAEVTLVECEEALIELQLSSTTVVFHQGAPIQLSSMFAHVHSYS